MTSKDIDFQTESIVSFVLVSYNQEKFIREAVEGALSQSYSPLEIVLSDDCSTDKTFEIIKEVVSTYNGPHRIILNQNSQNVGLSSHLNYAFSQCSGQLIVVAAGDDISLRSRAASLYQSWIDYGKPYMINSRWKSIDQSGNQLSAVAEPQERESGLLSAGRSNISVIEDYLNGKPFSLIGATAAYSQELIRSFPKLDDDVISEDVLLCLRSLLLSDILCVDDALVLYRQHDSSISNINGSGAERFVVWSVRYVPTFECFYKDLRRLFGLRLLSLADFIRLGTQTKSWARSAPIMKKWHHASSVTRLLWLFPGLMLCGNRRHKKFAINNIFSAQRSA